MVDTILLNKDDSIANYYEKLNVLDRGTFGVVRRARDLRSNEIVAIKKFTALTMDDNEGFSCSFLRELNVLATLKNVPFIVQYVLLSQFSSARPITKVLT